MDSEVIDSFGKKAKFTFKKDDSYICTH